MPASESTSSLLTGLLYGGDYNPEQWPEEIWLEDVRLMQEAGVNCVSLAIFGWAKLEPRPGQYEFGWLDRVLDLLHAHGIRVLLATATASPPPWFSRRHPDSLPVDSQGLRFKPGSRQHYCPNHAPFRQAAAALAHALATRYAQHPAVLMWHVNNEYACHASECYCDTCKEAFRGWLKERYGTLATLNEAWGTAFWSQQLGDWDEIELPHRTLTFRNPGQVLDYKRFMNASVLGLFRAEIAAIRSAGAQQPLFTNMVFGLTALDQFEWAAEADCIAVDSYPDPALHEEAFRSVAFVYDLMRSAARGKPFLLLEQATTQVNWRSVNQLKPPGMMRALSYQAVARGADSVMFFQWRASRAGAEKYHSAMVPHGGAQDSRVFQEVASLGAELRQLSDLVGSQVESDVGLLFSFENVWALMTESKPAQIDVASAVLPWHEPFVRNHIPVTILHPNSDLSRYRVLVAPLLYLLTQAQADALRAWVHDGGTLVMSYFSGIVDAHDRIWLGGYPALLRDVLGLTVTEWQPLMPGETACLEDQRGRAVACDHWVDLLRADSAEVLAHYTTGFYAGGAAITRHSFGRGQAYYIGTRPDAGYLAGLVREICADRGIMPLVEAARGVEASLRIKDSGRTLFVINHTDSPEPVTLRESGGTDCLTDKPVEPLFTLEPYGVRVIRMG